LNRRVQRRVLVGVVLVAVAAGGATAYAFLAAKRYDATARVVVHPVAPDDRTFAGIEVLRDSANADLVLATAASYFETPQVVDTVSSRIGLSPQHVRDSLEVHVLGGTNVLEIVGKDSNASRAAQIANGIAQEGIAERTARFQAQLEAVLAKIRGSTSPQAEQRVVDLQTMRGRPDPTLESLSSATAPVDAASPKPEIVIPATALAALGLAALIVLLPPLLETKRRLPPVSGTDAEADDRMRDREEALLRRQAAIRQRERELGQAVKEAREATAERERLEERASSVAAREQELETRESELARHEGELEDRESALAAREAAPPPRSIVTPRAELGEPGAWTTNELERLVAEHGDEHPDRVEEWRYYVHFLREHADLEGRLPAAFDYLVEEAFSELL
jgi:capsular polysaccharide biosynthesis protein